MTNRVDINSKNKQHIPESSRIQKCFIQLHKITTASAALLTLLVGSSSHK